MSIGGHHNTVPKSDEWLTPPGIVEALGPFDLDPATPEVQPWPTAAARYTVQDNALLQRWFGRVWLNPPYSKAAAFMGRMAEHGCGTALIFARTETRWWHRSIWPAAHAVLFMAGRINFHHPDGTRATGNAGAPTALVAYGDDDADRLAASDIPGHIVMLVAPRCFAVLTPATSWQAVVTAAVGSLGGRVRLSDLYRALSDHPKTRTNRHWQAKIRQQLQRGGFDNIAPGVWTLDVSGESND